MQVVNMRGDEKIYANRPRTQVLLVQFAKTRGMFRFIKVTWLPTQTNTGNLTRGVEERMVGAEEKYDHYSMHMRASFLLVSVSVGVGISRHGNLASNVTVCHSVLQ